MVVEAEHGSLGRRWLSCDGSPELLFTDNDTNVTRLFGIDAPGQYFKDGINDFVVNGRADAVSPTGVGTKAAAHYELEVPAGGTVAVKLRLSPTRPDRRSDIDAIVEQRRAEADEFYASVMPSTLGEDGRSVMRQSLAGMLWSKQFYHYDVDRWLEERGSDPFKPGRKAAPRNDHWHHMYNGDVISMPDKWEYPWYAAWDLAFHMIPFAEIDPQFAKEQLVLFTREWYMHPNGQLPAYEFALGDVNPPVHAWACWRVYKMTGPRGGRDRLFLARAFTKLLLNFTWWVNRKDVEGKHLFAGGFLGLDNIGLFDRSRPLPDGGRLEQADGTAWMAFYCQTMLQIALELLPGVRMLPDQIFIVGLALAVMIALHVFLSRSRTGMAMRAMAEADLRAMTRMIEGDAAVAVSQLQAARDRQAALNTDVLPRARMAIEPAVASYASGQLPLVSVIEAIQALWLVQSDLIAADTQLGLAWVRLGRAIGSYEAIVQ